LLYAHGFDGKSLLNVTLVEMQALDSQAAKHQKDTLSESKAENHRVLSDDITNGPQSDLIDFHQTIKGM
jgi:hypothetical protein